MPDDEAGPKGPEFEVWNHLWGGLQMAIDELRALEPQSRKSVEWVAKVLVGARSKLTQQANTTSSQLLGVEEALLAEPWIRHAIEIEIAALGIERAEVALKRFLRLRPVVTKGPIPLRAEPYISEVINTFIFGFDAACIALCRATLEQILRDELIRKGEYTAPQLKRERPPAGKLLATAKRTGILKSSASAASRLVTKGDTVMHQFLYDSKVSEKQAIDSIDELLAVISEIFGSGVK